MHGRIEQREEPQAPCELAVVFLDAFQGLVREDRHLHVGERAHVVVQLVERIGMQVDEVARHMPSTPRSASESSAARLRECWRCAWTRTGPGSCAMMRRCALTWVNASAERAFGRGATPHVTSASCRYLSIGPNSMSTFLASPTGLCGIFKQINEILSWRGSCSVLMSLLEEPL